MSFARKNFDELALPLSLPEELEPVRGEPIALAPESFVIESDKPLIVDTLITQRRVTIGGRPLHNLETGVPDHYHGIMLDRPSPLEGAINPDGVAPDGWVGKTTRGLGPGEDATEYEFRQTHWARRAMWRIVRMVQRALNWERGLKGGLNDESPDDFLDRQY